MSPLLGLPITVFGTLSYNIISLLSSLKSNYARVTLHHISYIISFSSYKLKKYFIRIVSTIKYLNLYKSFVYLLGTAGEMPNAEKLDQVSRNLSLNSEVAFPVAIRNQLHETILIGHDNALHVANSLP